MIKVWFHWETHVFLFLHTKIVFFSPLIWTSVDCDINVSFFLPLLYLVLPIILPLPPLTVHKEVCRTSPFTPQENLCINPPDTTGPRQEGGEGPGDGLLGPRPHFRLLTSSSFSRTWDLLKKLQTLKKDMDMPNYTPTAAVWTLWLYINRHIDISINGYS